MNRFFCPFWLFGLVLFPLGARAQDSDPAPARVEGEFLVRWASQRAPRVLSPGTSPARWQQSSLKFQIGAQIPGARVARTFAGSGWSLVKIGNGAAMPRLSQLLGSSNVVPNFVRRVARIPNDPEYSSQWQWPQIKAEAAWNLNVGSSGVVVAVLDTGIDLNHADLAANLWKNPHEKAGNGIDDDKNGYIDDVYGLNAIAPTQAPQDENGHGTHCAGLVGAAGNNEKSVSGVCWGVKIMALRFLNSSGQGNDADAIECLEYAVKMKQSGVNLRVISNSWSGPKDNPALKAAFQLAEKAGILSVCAAGNGSTGRNIDTRPEYPASYNFHSLVSVAASDQSDARAGFSNYGVKSVDLAAPGTAILSLKNGGGTVEESGTSMATPIVAGAAALLCAREPALSALQIKARLLSTVDPIAGLKGKMVSGGRLNLFRALTNATLHISGVVFRKNGSARVVLAGAIIKLGRKTVASTGADGRYLISDLAPGNYQISAGLRGYTFAPVSLVLPRPSGSGAPNGSADFGATGVSSAFYQISGHATNDRGGSQSGVSIFLSGVPNAVAVTDSRGNYQIGNRAAGTYKLSATGGDAVWQPSASSVALPARDANAEAPNGIVNFTAGAVDREAPQITISTPQNGARLAPTAPIASGMTTDVSGNAQLSFQLTRLIDFDFTFYNWTTKKWTTDANAPGIQGTQSASGTSANWSRKLPNLVAGSYSLRVWGRDTLGNESSGEADAVSSFDVVSGSAAKRSDAGVSGSGGSS